MKKRGTPALTSRINRNICPKSKRSQVTIFIILAIIIIVLGILVYLFYPKIKTLTGTEYKNPEAFIQLCLEDDIRNIVENLSMQGGSLEPEHYILYKDNKVEYLCYTNEYYKTCAVQQPMLKQHIESEIENAIQEKVQSCFSELKETYEEKGYNVNMKTGEIMVELLPDRILTTANYRVTMTKGESEQHDNFRISLNNNLYELVSIATNIISWEASYGDADTSTYMDYYHDLKVEKHKQNDGTKIYILTDRNSENKFLFASRSLVMPPGYGFNQ